LSLMLLCGVGMFTRSLQAAAEFDPGYARENVTIAAIEAPPGRDRVEFFSDLLPRLAQLPGVLNVGAASQFEIANNPDYSIVIEGSDEPPQLALMGDAATEGFFEAMGVPLIEGRTFAAGDHGKPLMIINQTLATQLWQNESPIGKRIRETERPDVWYTVVGVVADMRRQGIETKSIAQMFRPSFTGRMSVAIRGSGDANALASHIREQVATLAPGSPAPDITTVERTLEADSAPRRFHTQLLTAFAMVALILCAIGLFGLQRHAVERRRREIGLRMAVGANRVDVLRLIVGPGVKLILAGTVIGLAGSLWLASLVQSFLFGVNARDQTTLALSSLALIAVGVAASYLPARRATQIEPTQALKQE